MRNAGIALIISTILGIAVLAHHPGMPYQQFVQGGAAVARVAVASAWVHGTLMALLVVWYYCLTEFAVQRGLRRATVRLGLIAYSIGALAMLGAATIDGFVSARIPISIAGMAASGALQEPMVIRQVLVLSFALNMALANIGAVTMSLGIAAWSILLLREGWYEKMVGILGVVIGLATAPALMTGVLTLNRHGILMVEAAQAIWTVGIGVLLVRFSPGHPQCADPE